MRQINSHRTPTHEYEHTDLHNKQQLPATTQIWTLKPHLAAHLSCVRSEGSQWPWTHHSKDVCWSQRFPRNTETNSNILREDMGGHRPHVAWKGWCCLQIGPLSSSVVHLLLTPSPYLLGPLLYIPKAPGLNVGPLSKICWDLVSVCSTYPGITSQPLRVVEGSLQPTVGLWFRWSTVDSVPVMV